MKSKQSVIAKGSKASRAKNGSNGNQVLFAEVERLLQAIRDGQLDVRADLSKVTGTNRQMLEGINEMIDTILGSFNVTAEYIDRISKGDIPEKITDEYRGDFNEIKNNINGLIDSMNNLITAAANMEQAAANGELDKRVDVSGFTGAWATIVQGLNQTAEGMVTPMRDVGEVLDRMAAGDLKARVVNDYKGDYEVLKWLATSLVSSSRECRKCLSNLKPMLLMGNWMYGEMPAGSREI